MNRALKHFVKDSLLRIMDTIDDYGPSIYIEGYSLQVQKGDKSVRLYASKLSDGGLWCTEFLAICWYNEDDDDLQTMDLQTIGDDRCYCSRIKQMLRVLLMAMEKEAVC